MDIAQRLLVSIASTASVALGALVCASGTAVAGTVSVATFESRYTTNPQVLYQASHGEANRLSFKVDVQSVPGNLTRWAVVSDSVGVTAGAGCEPVPGNPMAARCEVTQIWLFHSFEAHLGDGDDAVTVEDIRARLFGGDGDDTLNGTPDNENLFVGGQGSDVMIGGTSIDVFDEGRRSNGSDRMTGNEATSGTSDWVDYGDRRRSVHVDVQGDRDDGERDERDLVAGVEGIVGGSGADRLVGGPATDYLSGGPGSDKLTGRGGDDYLAAGWRLRRPLAKRGFHDRLFGDAGNDTLVAGPGGNLLVGGVGGDRLYGDSGADRVIANDGQPDEVWCRAGRDVVRQDPVDLHVECERRSRQSGAAVPLSIFALMNKYDDLDLYVRLGCPDVKDARCSGSVRLEIDGAVRYDAPFRIKIDTTDLSAVIPEDLWQRIASRDPNVWVVVTTTGQSGPPIRVRVSDLRGEDRVGFYPPETIFERR